MIIGSLYWCFTPILDQMPKPMGSYGVGFKEFFIHGSMRGARASDQPINAQIWYPSMVLLKINSPIKHQISWALSYEKIRIYQVVYKLIH